MVGRPSEADFINMVQLNLMPNCPITTQDIKNAKIIFGKDVGALKGKTTRKTPLPVVTDYVYVPSSIYQANHMVTLCADIIFVNKIPFLTSVSRNMHFITAQKLGSRKEKNILTYLKNIINTYSCCGFKIKVALMDKEFDCLKGELSAIGMDLNPTAAAEHVTDIERSNRTIKERVWSVYCTLPYTALPNIMIEDLVNFCVMWLNAFPPKSGLSVTLSPRAIVASTNLNIKRHCRIPF